MGIAHIAGLTKYDLGGLILINVKDIEASTLAQLLSPVRVIVLKTLGKVPFSDIELIKGIEIEMPRWIAYELEKIGVVEVKRSISNINDINKAKFTEEALSKKSQIALGKIPHDFYPESINMINSLENKYQSEKNPEALIELEKVKRNLSKLSTLRLQKIILSALIAKEKTEELENNMSLEEKILFRRFLTVMNSWVKILAKSE